MRKFIFFTVLNIVLILGATAQEARFTAKVYLDSILMGNHFEVSFTLENVQGNNFQPPSFSNFNIVGGPNHSSSFSMVNGNVSQRTSYTYYLEPKDIGNYYIEEASVQTNDGTLNTLPLEIIVLPNPDGIKQKPAPYHQELDFFKMPEFKRSPLEKESKPKKKRKIYRI